MALHSEVGIEEDVVAEFRKRNNLSEIPYKDIAEFCERSHIRRLMIFGAWTRDVYELADNDTYIVFKDGHEQKAKSERLYALQDELRNILGVDVCLKTRAELTSWMLVSLYDTGMIYDATE